MTKAKKAISVVLAVVMIAGLFAFGAFAADQNATITVSASETQVEVGATVTVTVAATTDYYAAATSVPVYYDAAAFDLVPDSVTPSTDLYGAGYTDTAINTTEAGCVMVAFIPKAGGTAKQLSNTTLFTFQLTAKANAQASPIATKADDQKTATNIGGKLYLGAYSTADVNTATVTAVGQEFSLTNTAVTIGSAVTEPNTLVIKDTAPVTPYIDHTNCGDYTASVYGIDTLGWNDDLAIDGSIADCLTTTLGDEYLRITTPDSGVETTGTIIEVLDADKSSVLETYVFVYFGDVDADGVVGAGDSYVASYYELNYTGIYTLAQFMAADLDGDCWPTSFDAYSMDYFELNYQGLQSQQAYGAVASGNVYELV